jgi:uncharacterized protein YcsI (UPF0317 family)
MHDIATIRRHSEQEFINGLSVRLACRAMELTSHTAGLAPGFAQGNLVILPWAQADDFMRYCLRNPKPCPLLGVSEPGDPHLPALGDDIDLRTDLPRYRLWRQGEMVGEVVSIEHLWRDDFVAFVIGCSFTFEEALIADGIPLRHVACGGNVAMYRTSIRTAPAGPFRGPLVVSMRPMTPRDAVRAVQITSRYPALHGAPVHMGLPEKIGVMDLGRPDYGDPVEIEDDELPVFWACGVTPQAAIAAAKVDFAITHAPGCMLVTDRRNREYAIL